MEWQRCWLQDRAVLKLRVSNSGPNLRDAFQWLDYCKRRSSQGTNSIQSCKYAQLLDRFLDLCKGVVSPRLDFDIPRGFAPLTAIDLHDPWLRGLGGFGLRAFERYRDGAIIVYTLIICNKLNINVLEVLYDKINIYKFKNVYKEL